MSFPRYPKYKDAGVEWLSEVPENWRVLALRRCLLEHRQGYYSTDSYVDSGVKLLRITDLRDFGEVDFSDCPRVENVHGLEPFLLRASDFVFARTGGAGMFALIEDVAEPTAYASYLIRFRFAQNAQPRFLRHFFLSTSFQNAVRQNIHGGVNQNVHAEDIKNQYLALPPIPEQTLIAEFLDHETAKVDELVAQQRRLIELLKEKRQVVISHAVTKGLNAHAPMKPSGIEWLGDVPRHWDVSQLRYIVKGGTTITYGIVQAGPHVEDGIPYIKTSDMAGPCLPTEGYSRTSIEIDAAYQRSKVTVGDLVVAIRASVGKCLPVPSELEGANLTQGTAKISPGNRIVTEFLLAFLNSTPLQSYWALMAKGATFKEITLETLRKTAVLVPPLLEQNEICQRIESLASDFQKLIDEAEKLQRLLQERRTALISAAVTGKIDVRSLVQTVSV